MNPITYYNLHCDALLTQYNAMDPAEVHAAWERAHLREEPGFACDIGAGSQRDPNWLAAKGWEVVAVEPSDMREKAADRSRRATKRRFPAASRLYVSLASSARIRSVTSIDSLVLCHEERQRAT